MEQIIDLVIRVLRIFAGMELSEAKKWVDALENAEALRAEGHEGEE